NSTLVPGWAVSKSFPIVRNAPVSDAAAKTVTVSARAAVAAASARPTNAATTRARWGGEMAVGRMAVGALLPSGAGEEAPSRHDRRKAVGVDGRVPVWSGQRMRPHDRRPRGGVALRLRIDVPRGRVGPGKIDLLERIAQLGSISAAARAMRM